MIGLGAFLLFVLPKLSSLGGSVVGDGGDTDDEAAEKKFKFEIYGNHLKKELYDLGAIIIAGKKRIPKDKELQKLIALSQKKQAFEHAVARGCGDDGEGDAAAASDPEIDTGSGAPNGRAIPPEKGKPSSSDDPKAKAKAKGKSEKSDKAAAEAQAKKDKDEQKRLTDALAEAKKAKKKKTIEAVAADLRSGLPLRRIEQKLRPKAYVMDFNGNIMASGTDELREMVTLALQVASPYDTVVVRLTSPGGLVTHYGFASGQLERIRKAGLNLVVCVDTVAASGGYMMSVIASKIVAAPFAIVGSIGVVASFPNVNRVMKRHDVDYLLFTAGRYKRTVDPFTEVTPEGRQKMQSQLEDVHTAFIEHVKKYRPHLDLKEVATGEAWLAVQAKDKGLVDALMTSDEYLRTLTRTHLVVIMKKKKKKDKSMWKKALELISLSVSTLTAALRSWSPMMGAIAGGGGGGGLGAIDSDACDVPVLPGGQHIPLAMPTASGSTVPTIGAAFGTSAAASAEAEVE